jgi:hypothetical protein
VDQALKYVISLGMVMPDEIQIKTIQDKKTDSL